jgi:hypothetical protein
MRPYQTSPAATFMHALPGNPPYAVGCKGTNRPLGAEGTSMAMAGSQDTDGTARTPNPSAPGGCCRRLWHAPPARCMRSRQERGGEGVAKGMGSSAGAAERGSPIRWEAWGVRAAVGLAADHATSLEFRAGQGTAAS